METDSGYKDKRKTQRIGFCVIIDDIEANEERSSGVRERDY